ncbi:hypothetical protein ABPG75_007830 [Micractinium tetrahymenae]
MTATWAEISSGLAALLPRSRVPSSVADAQELLKTATSWQALSGALPPHPPGDAERAELLRLLRELGCKLVDWDAGLQAQLQNASTVRTGIVNLGRRSCQLFLAAMNASLGIMKFWASA